MGHTLRFMRDKRATFPNRGNRSLNGQWKQQILYSSPEAYSPHFQKTLLTARKAPSAKPLRFSSTVLVSILPRTCSCAMTEQQNSEHSRRKQQLSPRCLLAHLGFSGSGSYETQLGDGGGCGPSWLASPQGKRGARLPLCPCHSSCDSLLHCCWGGDRDLCL